MIRDETEARAVFTERYATTRTDLHRRIEQAVIGSDFGANGYTTLEQANRLAELLGLDAMSCSRICWVVNRPVSNTTPSSTSIMAMSRTSVAGGRRCGVAGLEGPGTIMVQVKVVLGVHGNRLTV